MKTRVGIAAISALSLSLGAGGCGSRTIQSASSPSSPSSPSPPTASAQTTAFAWKDDGNSLVPVCSSTTAPINCISNFTIRDVNTGTTVTVPITANSYKPVDPSDPYEIRVDGFDGDGNPISSPYTAFPTAP